MADKPTQVKCVIWDLDGTIWEGTLSEGGAGALRPGVADTIRKLDRRGIIQSIASKNDAGSAMKKLEEFGLADYFLCPQISWDHKSGSVQTILTFPHFLSWVIVAGIMMNILANNGAVNNLLATMGLEKYNFLTDKGLFRYILVFTLSWKEAGWSCILYIAAITGIDPSLYEAATIDGANRWHKILHITWPGILPVVLITLILRVGSMMDAGFDQVMNLYNNTVLDVADILDTYIYRITFQRMPNYGFSTAVGLFKGLTNCILLLSVNAVCKKINGTTIM